MIGLIDPALLLARPPKEEPELRRDIDEVIKACRAHPIDILPFDEYWPNLWRTLGRELEQKLGPETKRSLQQLRKLENGRRPIASPLDTDIWRRGFTALFGGGILSADWERAMAQTAARAAATDENVVLFTRRMAGRNLTIHKAGHVSLHENTRWVLYIQCRGMAQRNVLCVYNSRNLVHRWTARFDWRLPPEGSGIPFPFCPPEEWWKGATQSFRTVEGKPAWIDKRANAWSRPNIPNGAGYHWDVMISSPSLQRQIGLDQINVVEFGCPATEGGHGVLHHVPSSKAGRIRSGARWSCE